MFRIFQSPCIERSAETNSSKLTETFSINGEITPAAKTQRVLFEAKVIRGFVIQKGQKNMRNI
jgi:hypothetical protein